MRQLLTDAIGVLQETIFPHYTISAVHLVADGWAFECDPQRRAELVVTAER